MQELVKVLPEWINVTLLRRAIQSYKNDESIEVTDFSIKSTFTEHIASEMYKCSIDFQSSNAKKCETLNVIVKAEPIVDGIEKVATVGPLFENEIKMYTSTLPAISRLYERFGIKIDFAPE